MRFRMLTVWPGIGLAMLLSETLEGRLGVFYQAGQRVFSEDGYLAYGLIQGDLLSNPLQ